MKYAVGFIAIILIAGGLIFAGPKSSSEPVSDQQPAQQLNMTKINSEISNGASFIDVRTPEEYQAGHVGGAINHPPGDIQNGQMPNDVKDKTVYIYCRSGSRSAVAKSLLEQSGYTKIVDLSAMTDVVALGGKLVK